MDITTQTFWLPKHGSSQEEYEDAFSPRVDTNKEKKLFRCAVTDGATETSFSGLWAQLLADAYVANDLTLEPLQEQWLKQTTKTDQPWYVEEKRASGAFAALVGLTLRPSKDKRERSGDWEASAVGDSCLFHVRKKELLTTYPLSDWRDFDSSPALLSSNSSRNNDEILQQLNACIEDYWKSGDIFYLMSDAISCWFLRRQEEEEDAINIVSAITTQAAFQLLVDTERKNVDEEGRLWMRNDDTTLMRVTVSA